MCTKASIQGRTVLAVGRMEELLQAPIGAMALPICGDLSLVAMTRSHGSYQHNVLTTKHAVALCHRILV